MALVTTPAIILHTFAYGESSKIARMLTPDHGVVSVVAKGAHRPKSRFGARLQPLSEGTVSMYMKPHRDLHTLASFDLSAQHATLAHDLERYGAAVALAELMLRFSPSEPHPEVFELARRSLDALTQAPAALVPLASLAAMWGTVSALGFAPAMDACAVDGATLDAEAGEFSVVEGGLLCRRCAASRETASLPPGDRRALAAFLRAEVPEEPVAASHAAAHRRLFGRFVRRHVATGTEQLNALTFWERRE